MALTWLKKTSGGKTGFDNLAQLLAEQEDFSRLLQDTADIVVFTHDGEGQVLSVNRHGRWLSGLDEQLAPALSYFDLLHQPPDFLKVRLRELIEGRRSNFRHENALVRPGADPLLLAWWHVPWKARGSKDTRIISIGLDISDQRLAEEHLGWLALHDPLTGLLNRRGFLEEARQLQASGNAFSLMLLDLDQFKDINDLRGHHHGDRLLQQVGKVVRAELRQSDVIARLGGDEFGILLPGADRSSAEHAARRCCHSLHKLQPLEGEISVAITTSIGIVLFPEHGSDVDQLLANADIALYQAKARGRNAWHMFDGDDAYRARIHERLYWERQIRDVLNNNGVAVHYQPIMNLSSGEISHYEALLRCRNPLSDDAQAILPTAEMIIAAEQNGLIHRLDEQVISEVFQHSARLRSANIHTNLAINLSGLSFNNANLVGHIRQSLKDHNVEPSSIIFEITETAALADIEASIKIMEALRADGCQFALDDFGVGFSSLYYLKKLPVNYIKIDGSFIRNLSKDSENQVLIRALVDVAKAFKLNTIAEFVETQEVMQLLTSLGVDYGQGYHIEKPRSFDNTWTLFSPKQENG